jgi:molybdate transport system ATP-binding protein
MILMAGQGPSGGIEARFRVDRAGFMLDADLRLPGQGVSALFGPSGCGKTSTLRIVAGLDRVPGARVVFHGQVWQDDAAGVFVPPHRRPIGYVFQEASLFEHLDVERNLAYGMRRVAREQRRIEWDQAVALLGIGHLLRRRPGTLSGGERQRVAIARALLASPQLLLMDEPLAALDVARRREVLPYLERLQAELTVPILYVSHAPDEVARLADHLVLLEQGRVLASGPLGEILSRLDLPTALAPDAAVVIDARVESHDPGYHLLTLRFDGGVVRVGNGARQPGERVRLQVLARDVSLTLARQQDTSVLNHVPARVEALGAADTPAHVLVRLTAGEGGTPLLARVTRLSADQLGLTPGQVVWAQIKAVALLA